jgi:hypothetical protein
MRLRRNRGRIHVLRNQSGGSTTVGDFQEMSVAKHELTWASVELSPTSHINRQGGLIPPARVSRSYKTPPSLSLNISVAAHSSGVESDGTCSNFAIRSQSLGLQIETLGGSIKDLIQILFDVSSNFKITRYHSWQTAQIGPQRTKYVVAKGERLIGFAQHARTLRDAQLDFAGTCRRYSALRRGLRGAATFVARISQHALKCLDDWPAIRRARFSPAGCCYALEMLTAVIRRRFFNTRS